MTGMTLEGHVGKTVEIDVCPACQSFWFDRHESLKLSPGSTLKLMSFVGDNSTKAVAPFAGALGCPRKQVRRQPVSGERQPSAQGIRRHRLSIELRQRGKTKGIATLCIGGGEAVAMGVELV